jgi:hypothetical protein
MAREQRARQEFERSYSHQHPDGEQCDHSPPPPVEDGGDEDDEEAYDEGEGDEDESQEEEVVTSPRARIGRENAWLTH